MPGTGELPFIALPHILGSSRKALGSGETAVVYLRGTITWDAALTLKKQIEILVYAGVKKIDLMIASGGGSADAALMLVDLIESLEKKVFVRTIIDGVAASAATLVSVSGHERWLHKRGWMMLHLPSIGSSGPFRFNSAEMAVEKDNMDLIVEKMEEVYKRNLRYKPGGSSEANSEDFRAVKEQLNRDNYIRSERCLELKLIDHACLP